jgi:hypothetical protein
VITEIERYRTMVEAILVNEDEVLLKTELDLFVKSITPFVFLYGKYDYYTSLALFVEGYYIAEETLKARALIETIVPQYQERFEAIVGYAKKNKMPVLDRIKNEVLDYQELINISKSYDEKSYSDSLQSGFDVVIEKFN